MMNRFDTFQNNDDRERGRHHKHFGDGFGRGGHFGEGRFGGREGHGGGPRRGGPGRGGPGRMFDSGDLRLVMLQLLSEAPRHGYDIIKSIQETLGGTYAPSPGIVYPTLTLLEEMGLATVTTEGVRKLYSITPEGQAELEANRAVVDVIFARMRSAGQDNNERSPQIMRAIENIKMVLRMKTRGLATEQLNAVTDILDSAAKQIERL